MSLSHQHGSLKNIRFAFLLNISFAIFEFIGGIWTNSLALTSDALHDFGDSIALASSYVLEKVSKKKKDQKFSYGYRRFSLLAAFINNGILLIGSIIVVSKAVARLITPEHFNAQGVLLFAIVGIGINGVAALRLRNGSSLNEKSVSWHLFEDVFGWIAILVMSLVSLIADIHILDPIVSICISVYILYNVIRNLKSTIFIFLQGVPPEIDQNNMTTSLSDIEGVTKIHDMHVWSLDGESTIVTVHLVIKKNVSIQEAVRVKCEAKTIFETYDIHHSTIEIEQEGEVCLLS